MKYTRLIITDFSAECYTKGRQKEQADWWKHKKQIFVFQKLNVKHEPHISSLVSWNKKMSEKKCFTNFLQVLKDHIKSRVWNFFGEGFLRKSYLKFFYYITQSGYLSQKLHSICLSLGFQWFPLKKIFAQGVLGWPWLNQSAGNTTSLLIQAIFCTK